jgi:hypothetical protein
MGGDLNKLSEINGRPVTVDRRDVSLRGVRNVMD